MPGKPKPGFRFDGNSQPVMNQGAIRKLDELVRGKTVLEVGSGGSTLWLAQRAKEVVSVEHDPDWLEVVLRSLPQGTENVSLDLVPVDNLGAYIAGWHDDSEGRFDVVIIDCYQHKRPEAIEASAPLLPVGGHLVIDDAQWPLLVVAVQVLNDLKWEFELVDTYEGPKHNPATDKHYKTTTTDFWRRKR